MLLCHPWLGLSPSLVKQLSTATEETLATGKSAVVEGELKVCSIDRDGVVLPKSALSWTIVASPLFSSVS